MPESTRIVRFNRTEKYQCQGRVTTYEAGSVHRMIDDFAAKWTNLQSAEYLEDGPEHADLALSERPEPSAPTAPSAKAPESAAADPAPEPAKPAKPTPKAAAGERAAGERAIVDRDAPPPSRDPVNNGGLSEV